MKKGSRFGRIICCAMALLLLALPARVGAQSGVHTVAPGDTMWKIAVRYQIGVSELIKANP